jgi:kinetochor protein Mis14/NSL1
MATTNSNPARKIDLQSPSDLTHLLTVARNASDSRLAAAFPVSASDDENNPDSMRAQVAALLETFLEDTYAGIRQNVCVNGVAADGSGEQNSVLLEEEYEPFDASLAERIRALEEKKEVLTEKIAELRRVAPARAAEKWKSEWETEQQRLRKMEMAEQTEGGAEQPNVLDTNRLARWDEVHKTYSRALDGLVALKTGMAGTVGSLEEAKKVGEVLQSPP